MSIAMLLLFCVGSIAIMNGCVRASNIDMKAVMLLCG